MHLFQVGVGEGWIKKWFLCLCKDLVRWFLKSRLVLSEWIFSIAKIFEIKFTNSHYWNNYVPSLLKVNYSQIICWISSFLNNFSSGKICFLINWPAFICLVRYKNFQSRRNFWGFEGDSLIIGSFLCGCLFCLSSFCPIERLLFVSKNTIRLSSFWSNCPVFLCVEPEE